MDLRDSMKTNIPPFDEKKDLINVIVETPKGSRNKYAFDFEPGMLTLKKALPAGMMFPFDFGCIPGTKADDGDPLDVLVLMEEPVSAPCLVKAHLIGVIEAEQREDGKTERNDRLIAVTDFENQPDEMRSLKKLRPQTLKEIERFFISYNELVGKKFKVLDYRGPDAAVKLVKQSARATRKRRAKGKSPPLLRAA
jgi:inorganic pyrophosphatase